MRIRIQIHNKQIRGRYLRIQSQEGRSPWVQSCLPDSDSKYADQDPEPTYADQVPDPKYADRELGPEYVDLHPKLTTQLCFGIVASE